MEYDQLKKLHDFGFSLITLKAKSKRPLESDWTALPTKDWISFKHQHKNVKDANVGVRPGEHSKLKNGKYLAILDCDMKSLEPNHHRELLKALASVMPDYEFAPKVISGRNQYSMHVYCQVDKPIGKFQIAESHHKVKTLMPSKVPTKVDHEGLTPQEIKRGMRMAKAWEITFLGSGSQAVLPPSIHPDTEAEYKWEVEIESLTDLPDFATDKKASLRPTKTGQAFKFVKWDTWDFVEHKVKDEIVALIMKGHGMEKFEHDRSRAIGAALNELIICGFSDEQILSIMTDSENAISEKTLEKYGQNNRAAGARWLFGQLDKFKKDTDAKVQFEILEEVEDSPLTTDEQREQLDEMIGWKDRLQRNQNNNGVKNCTINRTLILENDCDFETLIYNEFFKGIFYGNEPPWKKHDEDDYLGKEFSNADLTKIRNWFSSKWKIDPSENDIYASVLMVAKQNSFHPVRDYLRGIKWDGKPRLNRWLHTYLEAIGPKRYVEAVARKTLVGAVARIMQPGIKFDYALILEGNQGIGKSTALSILGGEWYTDAHIDPTSKDTINTIQNCWIIEMSEMVPAYKSDAEALKAFMTKTVDRARLAFEKKAESYPRQCIFIGTTNRQQYLADETGNRRYWPVEVGQCFFDELKADRDQLWAEAYKFWQKGEPLYFDDPEVLSQAKNQQSMRFAEDAWSNKVGEFLDNHKDDEYIYLEDVYKFIKGFESMDIGVGSLGMQEQKRIARILRSVDYFPKRVRLGRQLRSVWIHVLREKQGEQDEIE